MSIKNIQWSYWVTGLFSLLVLSWIGMRIEEMREVREPGNPSSALGPPFYFIGGWVMPLTGMLGIRRRQIGRMWLLRLHRPRGKGWLVHFPRRRSA